MFGNANNRFFFMLFFLNWYPNRYLCYKAHWFLDEISLWDGKSILKNGMKEVKLLATLFVRRRRYFGAALAYNKWFDVKRFLIFQLIYFVVEFSKHVFYVKSFIQIRSYMNETKSMDWWWYKQHLCWMMK